MRYPDMEDFLYDNLPQEGPVRIMITGSRAFDDTRTASRLVDIVSDFMNGDSRHIPELICGGAPGADTLIEKAWRKRFGESSIIKMNANWVSKAGGIIRNSAMIDMQPDLVVAFPSRGVDRGTADAVLKIRELDIPLHVQKPRA